MNGDLLGFRKFLDSYNVSFPKLELDLQLLIDDLKKYNVSIKPFIFDKFESVPHDNYEKDCKIALENAIVMLEDALDSIEDGKPPNEKW